MIKAFVDLVKRLSSPGMTVAEVGVWVGETTVGYLPYVSTAYCIDTFAGNVDIVDPSQIHAHRPDQVDAVYARFMENVSPWVEKVRVLRMDSVQAAAKIDDTSLDICFIDADHRYEFVKKDIEAYLPKVKKGGFLCGHDMANINLAGQFGDRVYEHYIEFSNSCWVHPGVIQAVHDFFGKDVESLPDTIWLRRV